MDNTLLLLIVIAIVAIVALAVYNNNTTTVPKGITLQNVSSKGYLSPANGTVEFQSNPIPSTFWKNENAKIANVSTGQCIKIVTDPSVGISLIMGACVADDPDSNFLFTANPDGTYKISKGNRCFDSSPSVLAVCDPTTDNQKWKITNV